MSFAAEDLQNLFNDLEIRMSAERDNLCALDGEIGDADHGIAMEQGMKGAAAATRELKGNLQDLFYAAAKGFLNAVGASSGPLYATAFLRAGKQIGAVPFILRDDLRQVISAMAEGIQYRGKAEIGQKTMLDAWLPAAEAASNAATAHEIVAAAEKGAASTRNMIATLGRAARLGERSLGHQDPGAVSAVIIIRAICTCFEESEPE
jgi:dihydroxyacetone kinase-like protein